MFSIDITDGKYEFWEKTNMPVLLESENVYNQKVEYIEFNPVRKHYVKHPQDWIYSSANESSPIKIDNLYE
ncbi:MAG: hypothetical protein OEL89_02125 [Candidatus Peregrinibacteria bacterium]|nr:hypothetical protein [Candidatus Peregrinibacteria bacterium]